MREELEEQCAQGIAKKKALKFIMLLGVVSLFADMTYEGARSITGPYLALLGASATAVGFVAGFGELIGYALRLVSGYLCDRTRKYWLITLGGYMVNLLAVPLLALAGSWEMAAFLIVAERMGKAIRNPARDTMLSHAAQRIGGGWGFGIHEALDQIGAILGPLIVAGVLFLNGDYRLSLALLFVPALLALGVLMAARILYPRPRDLEVAAVDLKTKGLPRIFWIYLVAASLIAAGYADFPLIAYHFEKLSVVPKIYIPVFYAVAMGVDALAALVFGRLYDRIRLPILIMAAMISSLFAPFVFFGGFYLALAGMALWGAGMGAQESIMRAAIAGMVSADKRSTAYGIFNAGFGLFWFLGSALMGILYDISLPSLVLFSLVMQVAAIVFLILITKRSRGGMSTLDF
ncbi:MAG: MFS transporter [Thermodesulfobacteriota bacterium]